MINQIQISVKLDAKVFVAIEDEMRCTGVKRNRLINDAVLHYINQLDEERHRKCLMGGM